MDGFGTPRSCPIRVSKSDVSQSATPRASHVALNVIIPMGGLGANEFTEAGYAVPKPMVPIVGRPLLFWLLDNLDLRPGDRVWLGLRRDVEREYGVERAVRLEYPDLDATFVRLDFETRGATETLYCILNAMDEASRGRRTIQLDADTLWFCDVLGGARALPEAYGASFYFHDDADDPSAPYSYVRLDPRTQEIVEIREKVAISRLANNGAYVFATAAQALAGLEALLDEAPEDGAPASPAARREGDAASEAGSAAAAAKSGARRHYVSGLIASLLPDHAFLGVRATDFANLGSPARLRRFLARLRRGEVLGARAMRFCFGLDGTLVTPPPTPDAYEDAQPIEKTVAIARELHAAGHTVVVWTDRAMRRRDGNCGRALADVGKLTFEQLEAFGIPYDEVVFGKPHADVYVDRNVASSLDGAIERSLGWDLDCGDGDNSDLVGGVKPRHFNAVRRVGEGHVEKTGPRSVLRGEIFWYRQIPANLEDLFPAAVSVQEHPAQELSSVLLTRVPGVTFSHLVANNALTPGRLRALLAALRRLHAEPAAPGGARAAIDDALLCSNYAAKVRARYAKHAAFFARFDESPGDCARCRDAVLAFLDDYEASGRFQRVAYVHGDPVFSNVLLTDDGTVKFLDMRGALGDELTTAGDVAYDLSKVYQSLCGYDFIILDVAPDATTEANLARLRAVFEAWLADEYPAVRLRDVRMIVAAHFFSIVPLHDNRGHQVQFLAKARALLADDAKLAVL